MSLEPWNAAWEQNSEEGLNFRASCLLQNRDGIQRCRSAEAERAESLAEMEQGLRAVTGDSIGEDGCWLQDS